MEIRKIKVFVCLITGVVTFILLMGGGMMTSELLRESRFRGEMGNNLWWQPAGKSWRNYSSDYMLENTTSDEETRELMKLLQQKMEELEESGMLYRQGKQPTCTSDEPILNSCIDPNCKGSLSPTISPENIRTIRKPVRKIGMDKLLEARQAFDVKPEGKKYVLITGASSNHFNEAQASIHSLHKNVLPHLTNYSFFFYDIGLSEKERQLIRRYSLAELKPFPFDKLPPRHRFLNCYMWKPLIIWAHLQTADYVMWFDASIYFVEDIRPYFNNVTTTGILVGTDEYHMPQHTHLKFFSYFGEQPCHFSPYQEISAGFQILHNEPFIRRLVIEPWLACALDPECMCPEETKSMLWCPARIRQYGKCHRYDQATMGFLLIKLFHEHRPSVYFKDFRHEVRQRHQEHFLELLETAMKPLT